MSWHQLFYRWPVRTVLPTRRSYATRPRSPLHLQLENLEDRTVLATIVVTPGSSIQAAVNGAAPGDTILVDPGTYIEQVTINKNLTIEGNGAGAIIENPATLTPDPFGLNIIVEVSNGATVNIKDMTVEGSSDSNPGINDGILVVGGATANISHSTVTGIRENPLEGLQTGFAVQVGGTSSQAVGQVGHAAITDSTITNYQKVGIVIGGRGSTGTISGNTVTGVGPTAVIAQNGIQVSPGAANATISNNTITGNEYTPGTVQAYGILSDIPSTITGNMLSGNDVGILSSNSVTKGAGTIISGNTLTNNGAEDLFLLQGTSTVGNNSITGSQIGVLTAAFGGDTVNANSILTSNNITNNSEDGILLENEGSTATTALLTAHFNRIVGNSVGLNNATTTAANATNNWWGSNAGPTVAGKGGTGPAIAGKGGDTVVGPAHFSPWLVLTLTVTPGGVTTASLTTNSLGQNTSAQGHVPNGIPVTFGASAGTISPIHSSLVGGRAVVQFAAGRASGEINLSATVDNQIVFDVLLAGMSSGGISTRLFLASA